MNLTNYMPENNDNYRADFNDTSNKSNDDISFVEPQIIKKNEYKKPTGIFFLLAVFALLAVIFGAMQWVDSIKLPFLLSESQQLATTESTGNESQDLLQLQVQDTDSDGLTDYDELYLYNTSMYLEDTDSDGYSDFQEIQDGFDPNCPKGSVCETITVNNTSLESDITNLTNEELRALLIEQGLSPEQVVGFDDQTLRETYNQALGTLEQDNQFSDLLDSVDLNLSPDEIRQVLIEQGLSESEVNQLTDQELTTIWQEALSETQTQFNQ